jgi:spore coat polysaccharide biosynthesis protein SpsF
MKYLISIPAAGHHDELQLHSRAVPSVNVVAIIQARMSSTRLPGKVLLPLAGKPVLEHVVSRIAQCSTIDAIVVATSLDPSDDVIEQWSREHAVTCFRGSLYDVLDRYYQAARVHGADVIVRITADCPAIDPTIVDKVVQGYLDSSSDFFGMAGEFPDGLDCTVFSFSAIQRAWREATLPSEREHVGPYIEKNPHLFKSGKLELFSGLAHLRWTLDEPQDLTFLQEVFSRLYRDNPTFHAEDVLGLLQREPELATINANIIRNEGYLKSLQTDNVHDV